MPSLSLFQTQAITELATLIYTFLPGKAHPYTKIKIDFGSIAAELGLAEYWHGGSKRPAIEKLFEQALIFSKSQFCPLIIRIVKEGIKYRNQKANPITQSDITKINELIEIIGFKIPELWDKKFINSLPEGNELNTNIPSGVIDSNKLLELKENFLKLQPLEPKIRGFAFEKLLNELFQIYNLDPRPSFRNTGEQIDGSLHFDNEYYLIEAKWEANPVGHSDLLIFGGKVLGHSSIGRGIFITTSSFSKDG